MIKKWKKGFAVLTAAAMVLGCAGCGAGKDADSSETKKGETQASSDKPYAGVTLKWALTDNEATGSEIKDMVKVIKEKTGIEIEFSIIPTPKAGEMDKVLVSLMAGDDLDIVGRNPLQMEEFYHAGVLEPMEEYAAADQYDLEKIYGGKSVKFDGKTYGIPAETDIWLTYYNKQIFDDAGIPYPEAEGWTWEKYVETAKKLTNAKEGIYGSYMDTYAVFQYMQAVQSGVPAYKEDGTANFDDPAFKENMEWYHALGNDLKIQPNSIDLASGTHPYNEFLVNGNIGMWVTGGWAASSLSDKEKYPRDWKVGILPMPYPEGQEPSSLSITSCYAIPVTSSNKEAAFEAIKCICENKYTLGYGRVPAKVLSQEEAEEYVETGLLPSYPDDGLTSEDFMAGWFDPNRKYISEKIIETADTTIDRIFVEEGALYGQGSQTLDKTMKNIQNRANEAIAEASK